MTVARHWDIFCSVVDNYGDAGICWRLARQLTAEHGLDVRLWLDDLRVLSRIAPGTSATATMQTRDGVTVCRWGGAQHPFAATPPAQVVIEGFGCGLPECYLGAMAALATKPVWINLEYLSAEAWVEGCHGLASRQPRLPLTRYFFFPGFTPATGGLLREHDLIARRDAFQREAGVQAAFWSALGIAPTGLATTKVSLFAYPNPALPGLLDAWADGDEPTLCVVPDGVATAALEAWTGGNVPAPGRTLTRGGLALAVVAFLAQDDYDRLLWSCDVNFVRGEDSFVRAQWAARPFVWNVYPQAEGAHRLKQDAFLARYGVGLDPAALGALAAMWRAWNADDRADAGAAWPAFATAHAPLEDHARRWAAEIGAHADLAAALVKFIEERV